MRGCGADVGLMGCVDQMAVTSGRPASSKPSAGKGGGFAAALALGDVVGDERVELADLLQAALDQEAPPSGAGGLVADAHDAVDARP